MEKQQKLDWGTIDWLYEPEPASMDHMRVGISHMRPGVIQPKHIHYGDEQLMYIISGHGTQIIGDETYEMKPGEIMHISTGMAHESVNDGDEDLVKLLVSVPALVGAPKVRMNESERVKKQETINKAEFLRSTVRELFRSMLAPLKIPLCIYDCEKHLVYQSKEYPSYCREHCNISENIGNCALVRQKDYWVAPYYAGPSASVCEHGIWVYALPIVSKGEMLGYIKAGHVRTRERDENSTEALPYNVPESTVMGIVEIIQKLSEAICNHYEICQMQVELQKNVRVLSDTMETEKVLQNSLKTTQDHAFNLQINQHFLFNTLSTISGMAIRENAINTFEAVGALSQLLRYTLRTSDIFVKLFDEAEYLKNYSSLQQMRFGKRLDAVIDIPSELNEYKVPFNFLQPIVENCFKHGFHDKKGQMKIRVKAVKQENNLIFEIKDNGIGMTPEQLNEMRNIIADRNIGHGTGMVVQKLESLYNNSFGYEVDGSLAGTTVTVTIPVTA